MFVFIGGSCIEGTEAERIADCKVKCEEYRKNTKYSGELIPKCVKEEVNGKTYNVCRCRDVPKEWTT